MKNYKVEIFYFNHNLFSQIIHFPVVRELLEIRKESSDTFSISYLVEEEFHDETEPVEFIIKPDYSSMSLHKIKKFLGSFKFNNLFYSVFEAEVNPPQSEPIISATSNADVLDYQDSSSNDNNSNSVDERDERMPDSVGPEAERETEEQADLMPEPMLEPVPENEVIPEPLPMPDSEPF